MSRGITPEREHETKELVEKFEAEDRYPGREKEVAARIVNKQRAQHGETQDAQAQAERGESPDRHLPIENYDGLTVEQITQKLGELSAAEVRRLRGYETDHRKRKTLLHALKNRLNSN